MCDFQPHKLQHFFAFIMHLKSILRGSSQQRVPTSEMSPETLTA